MPPVSESDPFRPPNGMNFRCQEQLSVAAASASLCQIASFLQNVALANQLLKFDDWWEHDGLHFMRDQLDIHGLFRVVESGRSIFEATPQDEYVCVGIAPLDRRWYLRFRSEWDEEGDAVIGSFDITLPDDLCDSFRDDVVGRLQCKIIEEPASAYFERIIQ